MPKKKPDAKIDLLANGNKPKKRKKSSENPARRNSQASAGSPVIHTPAIRVTCSPTPELWAFMIQSLRAVPGDHARVEFLGELHRRIEQGSDLVIRIRSPFVEGFEEIVHIYDLVYTNPNIPSEAYRMTACSPQIAFTDADMAHIHGDSAVTGQFRITSAPE